MKLNTGDADAQRGDCAGAAERTHVLFFQIGAATRSQLEDKAMAVARTLAKSPEIQQALRLPPDRAAIQPIAKAVEESNHLLFISITNMDGIRYSHRNPELVGKHFIGPDIEPALRGNENVSVNQGSLAKSLRVFTRCTTPSSGRLAWWLSASRWRRSPTRSTRVAGAFCGPF